MTSSGIIFDIQHYAIFDGPGIRTLVFFKGCPLKCQWCQNPESQLLQPQMAYNLERCLGCGQCVKACPSNALKMKKKRPVRDADICKICGSCAKACRNHAMEKIGSAITVDELIENVLRDKPFYDDSGGGVTFSGGEATLQPEFLLETLRVLKDHGIHTALETCGQFRSELIEPLLKVVDLFLFDIKHVDPARHREFTEVSTEKIIANFTTLIEALGAAVSTRLIPRIPLIPGVNDDAGSIKQFIAFFQTVNWPGSVHLMPYNQLHRTKWRKIGREDEFRDFGEQTTDDIARIRDQFESAGIEAVVNE